MPNDLTEEQNKLLQETRATEEVGEFQSLRAGVEGELQKMLASTEAQEPARPVEATVTELRALYLLLCRLRPQSTERGLLRDAIRLLDTAQAWFGEGLRSGQYRPRTAREVIEASKPWRQKLRLMGRVAFAYRPDLIAQFSDVNSSQTLEEERRDLKALNTLVKEHEEILTKEANLTAQDISQGKTLLAELEQRDLLGTLGLKNQEEALLLRNRLLTFAVLYGRKAAAKGALEFLEVEEERARFEGFTFGGALRRTQERKKPEEKEDETPKGEQKDPEERSAD